jgi:hypothetical protein
MRSPCIKSQPKSVKASAFLLLREVALTLNCGICAKYDAVRPPKNPEAPVMSILGMIPNLMDIIESKNGLAIFRKFNFIYYGLSQLFKKIMRVIS